MRVQTISQRRENPILNIKPTNAQNLPKFVAVYYFPEHICRDRLFRIEGVSSERVDRVVEWSKNSGYREVWSGWECHLAS